MGDLRKLIAAVEAGTATGGPDALAVPLDMSALIATVTGDDDELWSAFVGAHDGSLDDAKALHEALLPGWSWRKPAVPWEADSVAVQNPKWTPADDEDDQGGYPWFKGQSPDPARAWLLAILRALEAEGDK